MQQKEAAEDVVQDTFLSAYKAYDTFKITSNVKTWLLGIFKHKIADYYRAKYKSCKEVSSDVVEELFDKNHRSKPEFRPGAWGDQKELLDDPEFTRAFKC